MASSDRRPIATDAAPTPTGPFSQAIVVDRLVFTAGQAGRNRDSGQMGDLGEQVTWALANLAAILAEAGTDLDHAVKATVFVRDGVDTAPLNAVWERAFSEPRPARSTVFVSRLKNPEMLVEIELVAVLP
ncbi:MAG TPA: Rid family hydrolase [Ilumatobacter sp.]|nr:Rid family hydrolase [Ilumatobacter sp.]